nr:hypothetical protein [Kofleriaceae bacterium]
MGPKRVRNRALVALIAIAGCKPHAPRDAGTQTGSGAGVGAFASGGAAFGPPLAGDPRARGAAYLAQIAVQLQPAWGQFLEDCRTRLAPTHALNDRALV